MTEPCSYCGFSGAPTLVEELGYVRWMLDEVEIWQSLDISEAALARLRRIYTARKRKLEVALALRRPPFTSDEAPAAWTELTHCYAQLEYLLQWRKQGYLNPVAAQPLFDTLQAWQDELLDRLEDHPRPADPPTDAERLAVIDVVVNLVEALKQQNAFATPAAQDHILPSLLAEKERLEIASGLREARARADVKAQKAADEDTSTELGERGEIRTPEPVPGPAQSAPRLPFHDRLWRTLLSERTLNAMLFLGIFLLFSAAVSFVVWGWKDFSAPLRVAIPSGFTALFFVLGWSVRTRTTLYNSGIALSAIGSLLIPIDFYTVYANFDISPDVWPEFWMLTSLFCLGVYLGVTLSIQSALFGYLVGAAAGSVVLAAIEIGYKTMGLSRDWYSAGLSGLAASLVPVAMVLSRHARAGRWRVLAVPFRYLALLTVGALMPLTLAWRVIDRQTYDALHHAMTVTWLCGAFLFGWGAVYYRSRGLGLLAATALPVTIYMGQAALFDAQSTNLAWHALGWAILVPLYLVTGHRLSQSRDLVVQVHGRTANRWGVALLIVAALWSLTDLSRGLAAACSHAILTGAVVLAAWLWRRPAYLYGASLLSLTASTFAMTELDLTIAQLSVGWASLALIHSLVVYGLGRRSDLLDVQSPGDDHVIPFLEPLVTAGYVIAALALLPPLFPYDGDLLVYTLGNWLGLAAWGAWLSHKGRRGFRFSWLPDRIGASSVLLQSLTALPLPFWLWVVFANARPVNLSFALVLAALAWGMVALSYRLERANALYRAPWYVTGLLVSVAAPVVAFVLAPDSLAPSLCLLSAGILYFADALTRRQSVELVPAALAMAWGYVAFLGSIDVSLDAQSFVLAVLIATYFLLGLGVERRKSAVFTHTFLSPLYHTAHLLTLGVLAQIYLRPLTALASSHTAWTEVMQQWGAASQLVLGVIYGLYAWGTYRERWGHAAAWLGTAGAGFLVLAYSQGRGSSAAKAALIAIVYVLAERGLRWLWMSSGLRLRFRAFARLAWQLYRRPLLVAGWTVSVGVIGLALIRNLWLLGGGHVRQLWAVAGLLLIVGLYALSARLFRRPRFVWFAALLAFAPWTILTDLGWFTPYRLTVPGFAASWTALAWGLFLLSMAVKRAAPWRYALPLRAVAHVLLPFALLWGIADAETSRVTCGLAVLYYGLAAWLDYRDARAVLLRARVTRWLYPALGLIPVWCVYMMAWYVPKAPHQLYGLMLLPFGPLGLLVGHWLRRKLRITNYELRITSDEANPQSSVPGPQSFVYGLPAYLTGYVAVIVGTMLVAHVAGLLSLVLLYDALLLLASARVFRDPLWLYPAALLAPISLLIALDQAGVPGNRHGWWLMGLATLYFALTWLLRRVKLDIYSTAPLAVGFVLLAVGLPPSSEDQIGALWGYGSAALLYAITAFWLRQPLLLMPACALSSVPYAVSLQRSIIPGCYYGLALYPGVALALLLGVLLDRRFGARRDFPWQHPLRWAVALGDRLVAWWALPLYTLGFGLGVASPVFVKGHADLAALNALLLAPVFAWAISRFRLRGWLLALALAGHAAATLYLGHLGWWRYPAWAWAQFLPLTLVTVGAALWIELRRGEGAPMSSHAHYVLPKVLVAEDTQPENETLARSSNALAEALSPLFTGWSRPLYLVALFDVLLGQWASLRAGGVGVGALLSLVHALLLAVLASVWRAPLLPYASALLGVVALRQWWGALDLLDLRLPVLGAWLAFAYGLVGYGMALWQAYREPKKVLPVWLAIWQLPLQRVALVLSFAVLALAAWLGLDLVGWTLRAMFGMPFRNIVDLATVRMAVGVLSWVGLLYVAATVVYRRVRLGYVALGMLLAGWMLYAFYIQQWADLVRLQWYAVPAGLYLLAIAYVEWQRENRALARWLDYAAMALMVASLFWQTLRFGWRFALMLGAEGFALIWWGSARRARRFFYVGMVAVILATLGQLINALQDVNQWIVFGLIGSLLIGGAALVERKLEEITSALREVLEDWE